jgi:hypothetical protein
VEVGDGAPQSTSAVARGFFPKSRRISVAKMSAETQWEAGISLCLSQRMNFRLCRNIR